MTDLASVASTQQAAYLAEDYCGGGLEIFLDVFVILKAIILIYFSAQGISWFLKNKFTAMSVVAILVISCALVFSEMIYRFTDRSLKYRFIQNSIAMWSVFVSLTVMMGFARKNDAAKSKVPIRMIFIPVHILYFTLLIWGILNERMGQCKPDRSYPPIFAVQYSLFFLTYFGFFVMHKSGYFMEWHESIQHLDLNDVQAHSEISGEEKARLKVRIIFEAQAKRFMCFFTWLICLTAVALAVVTYHLKKGGGDSVGCALDGNHWMFADCSARFYIQFLHVFTTMQCAATARVVFVKTVKKVNMETEGFLSAATPNASTSRTINFEMAAENGDVEREGLNGSYFSSRSH